MQKTLILGSFGSFGGVGGPVLERSIKAAAVSWGMVDQLPGRLRGGLSGSFELRAGM